MHVFMHLIVSKTTCCKNYHHLETTTLLTTKLHYNSLPQKQVNHLVILILRHL